LFNAVILAAVLSLWQGSALAQEEAPAEEAAVEDEDEETRAARHFDKGRKLYGEEKYKEAIEELLKAYDLRPAPPILLNIARTYEKLDQKKKALKFYKEFLLKARMMDPNRPMVENVVKELERDVGSGTGAVTSSRGTDTTAVEQASDTEGRVDDRIRTAEMIHTPVDSAQVRKSVTLIAELPPDVEANFVVVNYRRGGELKFRQLAMEQQGEAYVGQIPGKHITSTSLQYYIQAVSTKKGIVAMSGNKRNPHIIVIEGGRTLRKGEDLPEKASTGWSPTSKWLLVSAGGAVVFAALGGAFLGLSADRNNAIQEFYEKKSCANPCTGANCSNPCPRDTNIKGQELKNPPQYAFDYQTKSGQRPMDWENEGKMFNTLAGVFMGLGAAALGVTGYFLYKELTWKGGDADLEASRTGPDVRFSGTPWAGANGAGFVGRIQF